MRSRVGGSCTPILPLPLQIGPCRIEHPTPHLLRVIGGTDRPGVQEALLHAGGCKDGHHRNDAPTVWWVPAANLPSLRGELLRLTDPLFRQPDLR
jgi:hypothetical protein